MLTVSFSSYEGKRVAGKSAVAELLDMLKELSEEVEEEQVRKEPETHSETESTEAETTETEKTERPADNSMWAKRAQQLNVKCMALHKEIAEKDRYIAMLKADLETFRTANAEMAAKLNKIGSLMKTYD